MVPLGCVCSGLVSSLSAGSMAPRMAPVWLLLTGEHTAPINQQLPGLWDGPACQLMSWILWWCCRWLNKGMVWLLLWPWDWKCHKKTLYITEDLCGEAGWQAVSSYRWSVMQSFDCADNNFQCIFLEKKSFSFYANFTEVFTRGFNWQ